MVLAVLGHGHDDGALSQQGFYQKLLIEIPLIGHSDPLLQLGIADVIDAADVEGRVCPGALGDLFDHIADPTASLHQNHIARTQFIAQALEVAKR